MVRVGWRRRRRRGSGCRAFGLTHFTGVQCIAGFICTYRTLPLGSLRAAHLTSRTTLGVHVRAGGAREGGHDCALSRALSRECLGRREFGEADLKIYVTDAASIQ